MGYDQTAALDAHESAKLGSQCRVDEDVVSGLELVCVNALEAGLSAGRERGEFGKLQGDDPRRRLARTSRRIG